MKLKIKRLSKDALLPTKKYPSDAGFDLYMMHNYWIRPYETLIIPLGIAIEIPKGFVGILKEKSGLRVQIGAGVIDSSYRGEIKIKVRNVDGYGGFVRKDRDVAQLLILPCPDFEIEEVEELSETERGEDGGINQLSPKEAADKAVHDLAPAIQELAKY